MKVYRIGVIGAGSWGTTLADLLARKGHDVTLWAFESELVEEMIRTRENRLFLSGIRLADNLIVTNVPGPQIPLFLQGALMRTAYPVVPLFEKYVRKVVEALKEYTSLWCTINEPNVYALNGYVAGDFPTCKAGHKGLNVAMKVLANMLRGHAAAYKAIHALQPEARVGYALHYRPMVAARPWFPRPRSSPGGTAA